MSFDHPGSVFPVGHHPTAQEAEKMSAKVTFDDVSLPMTRQEDTGKWHQNCETVSFIIKYAANTVLTCGKCQNKILKFSVALEEYFLLQYWSLCGIELIQTASTSIFLLCVRWNLSFVEYWVALVTASFLSFFLSLFVFCLSALARLCWKAAWSYQLSVVLQMSVRPSEGTWLHLRGGVAMVVKWLMVKMAADLEVSLSFLASRRPATGFLFALVDCCYLLLIYPYHFIHPHTITTTPPDWPTHP